MEKAFEAWGLPKAMKFDNGLPFGDPHRSFVPALALWLTGLGIKVIWNRTRTPQDNAKVERMQGVTARWSEARKCSGIGQLRHNLEKACEFQREKYPTRVLKGIPRIVAFPELKEKRRPYSPELFDIQKVKEFLGKGIWERKVSQVGQVEFANKSFYLGKANARQLTYATYLSGTHEWSFEDAHGKKMGLVSAEFTAASIKDLSAFQNKRATQLNVQ